jgi:hypothetical protein
MGFIAWQLQSIWDNLPVKKAGIYALRRKMGSGMFYKNGNQL